MRFIVLQRRTMWVGKLQKISIVKKRCLFGYNVWSQNCCSCWWIVIHFFNIFFCSVSPSFPGSWLEVRRSWGVWAASVPRGRGGEERWRGSLTCSKCRTSSMTGWRKENFDTSVQIYFDIYSPGGTRHQTDGECDVDEAPDVVHEGAQSFVRSSQLRSILRKTKNMKTVFAVNKFPPLWIS